MKKKHFKRIFAFLLAVLLSLSNIPATGMTVYAAEESGNSQTTSGSWTDYAASAFESGEGTEASPYIIKTADQLALLAKSYNTTDATNGKYFQIADDVTEIDLSAHEWLPINVFSGTFDGNGATIKGLKIGSADTPYATIGNVGLFASITAGTVKNLTVDVAIYTDGDTSEINGIKTRHIVGGIAGECKSATVDGCKVTGAIICKASGAQQFRVGGVVGDAKEGTVISNCVNEATISADGNNVNTMVGGLIGWMEDSSVASPYVVNSYNLGNVTATTTSAKTVYAGGIVGGTWRDGDSNTNYLLNCYNAGSVSAAGGATSLEGSITGQIAHCTLDYLYYLEGTSTTKFGNDLANSQKGTDAGVRKEQAELQGLADTLNSNAASLAETYTELSLQTWKAVENGYPVLSGTLVDSEGNGSQGGGSGSEGDESGDDTRESWTDYAADDFGGGEGTEASPYIIKTADQLALLAKSYNTTDTTTGKYFQIADGVTEIDLSAHEWLPINVFSGTFDGNGATIKGLKIGSADTPYETIGNVGLFASITAGTVKNLTVDVAIYTDGDTSEIDGIKTRHIVGGIAGECKSATVDGCKVTGAIICKASGAQQFHVGGVVGDAKEGTVISNCVNEATIGADGNGVNTMGGGLVAWMEDSSVASPYVVNCCNLGSVTVNATGKTAYAGGIVGGTWRYEDSYTNYLMSCYNAGSVSATGATSLEGSITGQAAYCTLAYLYWMEGTSANVFGTIKESTLGSEASTAALTADQLKAESFRETLSMSASLVNENYSTNAYKWVANEAGYAVPGSEVATDKVLNVAVNSERMGSVKVEVKAPDTDAFVETTTRAMMKVNSAVRLTPLPISGIKTDSMTVDGESVTLTNGCYEFEITASTNAEIVFAVETIFTAKPIYVDPDVDASGDGTSAQTPFKTLEEARDKVRTILAENPTANVTVYLMGGTYVLDEMLELDSRDTSFGRVTFQNYENETPVITSGHLIPTGGFKKEEGKAYYAYQIPKNADGSYPAFRDLLVNGERATLAKTKEYTYVKSHRNETASGTTVTACENGLYISKEALGDITNETLNGVELGQLVEWKSNIFRIGNIIGEDTASGEMEIQIKDYEWALYNKDVNKRVLIGRKYWLQNHMSFLDEPGEFYYDQQEGKIYYYPYADEDMRTVTIEYATLDNLINIQNAANITFDGITFTGTTANYITERGLVSQLGCTIYTLEKPSSTGDYIPISAILADSVEGMRVQNCTFEELGGSAMVFKLGVKDLQVTGNVIKDIAMAGVLVGKNQFLWNDGGLIGSSENVTISNNYITNIGLLVYGAPGIKVARSKDLKIQHNTIIHVPYSGVMTGFGWSDYGTEDGNKNLINADISYNYVEDYVYKINDGGALYTCGANDFAANAGYKNYIHHNYVRAGAHNKTYTGIYHDGGASNWHTYANVVDDLLSDKGPMFFQDDVKAQYTHHILAENNYTTARTITTSATADRKILLQNNTLFADRDALMADTAAAEIVKNAGLEDAYKHIASPMDVELRMADATMHYVVDSSKDTNTVANIELTNNSDRTRTFTLSLTDALPDYVSCQIENDGKVTLEAGQKAVVKAEFSITDKENVVDTEDYVVGFQVMDSVGRKVLYPRTFTVRCSTGETRIAYGTPILDGKLDEAYKNSTKIQVGEIFNWFSYDKDLIINRHENELRDAASDVTGFARLLWDENYLYCYIYVEEKDGAVTSRGMDYINDMITNSPGGLWRNDNVELYIYTNGKSTKYGADAFGIQRYGDSSIHDAGALPYATAFTHNGEIVEGLVIKNPTKNQDASTTEKSVNGYVIEMTLPIKECSDLAVNGTPQAGDKIRFQMQNNDMDYLAEKDEVHIVSLHTAVKEYLLMKEDVENNVASIDGVNYATLEDALNNAEVGKTVKLEANATLPENYEDKEITLDLNGHSLTGDAFEVFSAKVMDSSNGKGLLVVPQNKLSLYSNNDGYMPVWDSTNNGYRFAKVTIEDRNVDNTGDALVFSMRPSFGSDAIGQLVAKGYETGMVRVGVRITWPDPETGMTKTQDLALNDSWLSTMYSDPESPKGVKFTISGGETIKDFEATTIVWSNLSNCPNVKIAGTTHTYPAKVE